MAVIRNLQNTKHHSMNKQRKLILAAAGIGVIATFLPWFSISARAFGYSASNGRNGFHEAGIFYFIFLVVVGIIAVLGDQSKTLEKNMRLAVIGSGIMALISLLVAYSQAQDHTDAGFGMVSLNIGIGLMLAFITSIGVIAIPFVIKNSGESLSGDLANLKGNFNSPQGKTPAAAPEQSRMSELEKLIEWKREGKITDEEYENLKSKII